jgi:hypothetical protein
MKCCEEDPIDDFSLICQECYDNMRVEWLEENGYDEQN